MIMGIRPVRFLWLQATLWACLGEHFIEIQVTGQTHAIFERSVKILKTCDEYLEKRLGVIGNPPEVLVSLLMSEPLSPVVLIDTASQERDRLPERSLIINKLQLFLVTASSSSNLRENLVTVRNSRWWNHMADFWLFEWPQLKNDCTSAYEFLSLAWRMNILEAKFICIHETLGTLVYGFNPFKEYAPDPWKLEKVYVADNGHPWSLWNRKLFSYPEPCRNMTFDKTKDLGGYKIRMSVVRGRHITPSTKKTGLAALEGYMSVIIKPIFRALNATATLIVHEIDEPLDMLNLKGKGIGKLKEIYDGTSDICLQPISTLKMSNTNIHVLGPISSFGLSIITQRQDNASQLNKIFSLMDVKSQMCILLVCLLTLSFFKYVLRQTWSTAGMNVVRMICNSCLPKIPSRTSSRIYLGSLFFLVVTLQGIYQGALSSLLAKNISARSIDNIEDLRKSKHTIYASHTFREFFVHPDFQGRFVGIGNNNCVEYVLKNSSNACIYTVQFMNLDEGWSNLYISKEEIAKIDVVIPIRQDWPLERKFNQELQTLTESHVYLYQIQRDYEKKLKIRKSYEDERRYRSFKVLSFIDLKFAFVILAVGLTMATVIFVIDMIRGRVYARSSRLRKSRRPINRPSESISQFYRLKRRVFPTTSWNWVPFRLPLNPGGWRIRRQSKAAQSKLDRQGSDRLRNIKKGRDHSELPV